MTMSREEFERLVALEEQVKTLAEALTEVMTKLAELMTPANKPEEVAVSAATAAESEPSAEAGGDSAVAGELDAPEEQPVEPIGPRVGDTYSRQELMWELKKLGIKYERGANREALLALYHQHKPAAA